jgi:hypothetical protein
MNRIIPQERLTFYFYSFYLFIQREKADLIISKALIPGEEHNFGTIQTNIS